MDERQQLKQAIQTIKTERKRPTIINTMDPDDALEFVKHFAKEMLDIGGYMFDSAKPTFDGLVNLFIHLTK